jgi:hypothetical protein
MRDIYHLLEADRPNEPEQPIPAPVAECDKSPVAECDKSNEGHASSHEPKAQVGTDLAA